MRNNITSTIHKALLVSVLVTGSLFAQNSLTITDNPVAAMLDSLANQKVLEKALLKPIYPKLNKEVIQKSNSERYYKRKLNRQINDQSNEVPTTEQ